MLKAEDLNRQTPDAVISRVLGAGIAPTAAIFVAVAVAEFLLADRMGLWGILPIYVVLGAVLGAALSPLLFGFDVRIAKRWQISAQLFCVIVVVGALLLNAEQSASPGKVAAPDSPDIVFISVDTLRNDRWQQLAKPEFAKFNYAELNTTWSTSGLTAPAHASMLTGLYPHQHGVGNNGQKLGPKDGESENLVEALHNAGWHTIGINSVIHLDSSFGFARGFDQYLDTEQGLPNWLRKNRDWLLAKLLLRTFGAGRAVRLDKDSIFLARAAWEMAPSNAPKFMWLHLFGPHWPYPMFGEDPQTAGTWTQVKTPGFPKEKVIAWQKSYDRGVGQVAKKLSRLVRDLQNNQGERPLWIVITGDHGEYLGEHGATDHGDLMYEEGLRVPLWVFGPNIQTPTIQPATSHVDVMPSLLEIAGLVAPVGEGRSWVPALRGQELSHRPIFAETRHASFDNAMVVYDDLKLVRNLVVSPKVMNSRGERSSSEMAIDANWMQEWEAYDLRLDPYEQKRLPGAPERANGDSASILLTELEAFLSRRGAPPNHDAMPSIAPEVLEALSALGYH